ncbi:MAG: hypothetical protein LC798_05375, partial [Chloroflexi bacterium]|nr:hypothetical protein [Chloroflexota bacterium]
MAADAGTAEIRFKARLDRLDKDMAGVRAKVERAADDAGEGFTSKMGDVGVKAGKALALGLAGAAVGAGAFLKSAVDGASNLAETLSKSNTIFGDQGKAMEQWAGTAAKAFGQSKQGALDAAATFGNLFVQLGTGSGEAAKMSQQMV